MARGITISRPDVVDLVERAAAEFTGGDKTEAVAFGMRRLLQKATLFGAHAGSVRVGENVDLLDPALDVTPDAETGSEIYK